MAGKEFFIGRVGKKVLPLAVKMPVCVVSGRTKTSIFRRLGRARSDMLGFATLYPTYEKQSFSQA